MTWCIFMIVRKRYAHFPHPLWGGASSVNTCPVDGWLAMMSAAHEEQRLSLDAISSEEPFEAALKRYIADARVNVDAAKEAFLKAVGYESEDGFVDLYGGEYDAIVSRLKDAFTLRATFTCSKKCGAEPKIRDNFEGILKPSLLWEEAIAEYLAPAGGKCRKREKDGGPICGGNLERQSVGFVRTPWILPFDISANESEVMSILDFPSNITMEDNNFYLMGASVFSPGGFDESGGHFKAVIRFKGEWFIYDGIDSPSLRHIQESRLGRIHGYLKSVIYFRDCLPKDTPSD